jgi:hypothetical protein
MPSKIVRIANAMISESLLPDFSPADFDANGVRITAFYQLNRTFQGNVRRRSELQMHMVGYQHKGMQAKLALPAIAIKSLQEKS